MDKNKQGVLLLKLRRQLGLTQEEMAKKIGVTRVMIVLYEKDSVALPVSNKNPNKKLINLFQKNGISVNKSDEAERTLSQNPLLERYKSAIDLLQMLDGQQYDELMDHIENLIVAKVSRLKEGAKSSENPN